jgi:hypothetical protein
MSDTELIEERLRGFLSAGNDSDWGDVLRRAAASPLAESSSDIRGSERRHLLLGETSVPARRRRSRRLALGGVGVLAAAGALAAVLLVVFAGAGAQNAFAGWTASPSRPASGQTASALSECSSRLAGVAPVPAAGWQPLVTDTRGPFTAVILHGTGTTATCLTGPSFTTAEVNSTQSGGSQHVLSVGSAGGNPPTVSVLAPDGASSGPIGPAEQQQTSVDGQPYTLLQGQIQPGVTDATLVLTGGSRVQATIADGSIVAWWPSDATATTAELTSGSGVTTQQLAFTSAPPPHPPTPTGQPPTSIP